MLRCSSRSSELPGHTYGGNGDDWQTRVHEPGRCATYGICGHRPDTDPLSCPDNGPPRALNDTAMQKLQTVCPQLAAELGGGGGGGAGGAGPPGVCCTEEQLDRLQAQVGLASAL